MSVELRVLTGARAGVRARFAQPTISIGRHPGCDFRFDPERDLDVSAHHAEIREVAAGYALRDVGSRNGTFVNGERLTDARLLRSGDVIAFGELGPRVAVMLARTASASAGGVRPTMPATTPRPAASSTGRTTERIAAAVRERTRGLQRLLVAAAGLLVVGIGGAYWVGRRGARDREAQVRALARLNDSLSRAYAARIASLATQVAGLDSSLAATRQEAELLRRSLRAASRSRADSLTARLTALESRRHAMLTAAQVDYTAIAARNGPAVVLIAVAWGDGNLFSGTGFCVAADGTIVTNRHLVARDSLERPERIAVIFSDTKAWLPAHVVAVSDRADLALLRVDRPGPFPAVSAVASSAAATPVGRPVAIIGYPLGTETPMEGSGTKITARSTLVAGTVSKNLATVVQIDAYAGEGSSGSPVFNAAGAVVAVVYGSARESGGRIVYAVPSDEVERLVRQEEDRAGS